MMIDNYWSLIIGGMTFLLPSAAAVNWLCLKLGGQRSNCCRWHELCAAGQMSDRARWAPVVKLSPGIWIAEDLGLLPRWPAGPGALPLPPPCLWESSMFVPLRERRKTRRRKLIIFMNKACGFKYSAVFIVQLPVWVYTQTCLGHL